MTDIQKSCFDIKRGTCSRTFWLKLYLPPWNEEFCRKKKNFFFKLKDWNFSSLNNSVWSNNIIIKNLRQIDRCTDPEFCFHGEGGGGRARSIWICQRGPRYIFGNFSILDLHTLIRRVICWPSSLFKVT